MKPEQWQEVDRLFYAALERQPEERAAYLEVTCAGRDSLRHDVQVLLAAHDQANSFIERPALEVEARSVANDQNELVAGQTVGHYKIVSPLGAGGMGDVYLAQDTVLGRKVALKLVPACFTEDPDRLRRFEQEARAASALNHPNIVTTYEIGHDGPFHFIAEEFIDGVTLRERMSERRLELNDALEIATQVASALAAAHAKGIVHRDIKPENIMVDPGGHILGPQNHVKILDFGIAKLTEPRGSVLKPEATTRLLLKTREGSAIGTAPYMSPEQTRGESVDARTDIWSFGVVLYEMLTGQQPFGGVTAQDVSASILKDDLPPLPSEFPESLGWIVKKSLRKDQEDRYQTARELFSDLRDLQGQAEDEAVKHSAAPHAHAEAAARMTSDFTTEHPATGAEYLVSEIKQHKRIVIISLCVLIVAVGVGAYFFYFAPAANAIDSIAVLPLANVSGDPTTEYLSDGISEALINSLTELRQLRVIARSTAFHYKGKDVDPQAVGRELGVRAVLMGRMRQTGDTLNIQVDLVDAATGAQLWGKEYERKASDVLSLKQSIARDVTQKLRLRLSREQQQGLTKPDTTNTEAYQFYLRGRYFWNKRTAEGLKKAIEQFHQAIDKDPNYALAYVGLADSYVLLEQYANTPASDTLPKARAAVERALKIDGSLAEAHASLGQIEEQSWNFSEAEREYIRAIELNPNYATAHQWYSDYLRAVKGRYDEAKAEIKLAQRLDPLSQVIALSVVGADIHTGELDAAIEEAKKVLELYPNGGGPHFMLGYVYRKQGRYAEAIAEFETIMAIDERRGSGELSNLGMCYAMAGNRDKARSILKEIEEQYHKGEAPGLFLASFYAVLGEKDQAFAMLEKDFQARSVFLTGLAYSQFEEADLRAALSSDPRWNNLLRRIGLLQN